MGGVVERRVGGVDRGFARAQHVSHGIANRVARRCAGVGADLGRKEIAAAAGQEFAGDEGQPIAWGDRGTVASTQRHAERSVHAGAGRVHAREGDDAAGAAQVAGNDGRELRARHGNGRKAIVERQRLVKLAVRERAGGQLGA